MTLEQLKTYVDDKIVIYPNLRDDILGLYQLCLDEIEDGGSEAHEISLCVNDIDYIIENEGLD